MLKFNTFRAQRYLRSRFIEGKFLLASEGNDIELELIDLSRKSIKSSLGNVFVGDAFKAERISSTQVLLRVGEAWLEGLPFNMRSAKDELVSGSILTAGIVPPGVTIIDDNIGTSDRGKIITFSGATPTGLYRIVITAAEEVVTSNDDIYLKNATITEDTSQKVRLNYKINVVLNSIQTESPVPYMADTGAYNGANLVNQIVISPTSGQNGELLATNVVSGANIDGRDLELVVKNDVSLGAGNPIPVSALEQEAFFNGTLIDSRGTSYHVNAVFLDSDTTRTVIRVDRELSQPNPTLTNGTTYILRKRDVYAQNESTGAPVGKMFLATSTVNWHATNELVHASSVSDLRTKIISQKDFQDFTNKKFDLMLTNGGAKSYNSTTQIVNWVADFSIINPHGPQQTIAAGSSAILDGGTLVYELDFAGGNLERGTLPTTVIMNSGATTTLVATDLSDVRVGNVIRCAPEVTTIIGIDDVNNTITVSPAITSTGLATIYKDSFGPGYAPSSPTSFTLAARKNNRVWFENEVVGDSGFSMDQAYCFTDGTGTEVNCSPPTVVSGKTRIVLNFAFIPGLNVNTANGQIEVFLNGQKIPRFIDGTLTPDASYTEVDSNTIDLDSDYSTFNISVDIIKPIAVIDTSEENSLRLLNFADFTVGTALQVASGRATHTDLADAIADTVAIGAGIVLIIADLTISTVITVPTNVKLKFRSKSFSITLASGGEIRYTGTGHVIEELYLQTTLNIVMLRIQSSNSVIEKSRFDAPPSGSATCIRFEGSANHVRECYFTGVISPGTSTGIQVAAGAADNTEENNIYTS